MTQQDNSNFLLYGGSIIGPPSKKRGKPNQDSYGHTFTKSGSALIIAADGAGSLNKSDIGAQLTVDTVLAVVNDYDENKWAPDAILEAAVQEARNRLLEHPDKKELGCTVAAALITENDYAVSITGDAFAVVYTENDYFTLIENEQESEYANITKLLTSNDTDTTVYYDEGKPKGIAVSSDGLAHFTIDNTKEGRFPTEGFWGPVFKKALTDSLHIDSLLKYMEQLEKTDDDTTLAIACLAR